MLVFNIVPIDTHEMIKVGIVDDEQHAVRVIQKYLDRLAIGSVTVLKASHIEKKMFQQTFSRPDLLFMDIDLLNHSTIDLDEISNLNIIFMTANDCNTIIYLNNQKYHCLLKPIDYYEFKKVVLEVVKSTIPLDSSL